MSDRRVARAYEALVAEGAIIEDAAQRQAVAALDGERAAAEWQAAGMHAGG